MHNLIPTVFMAVLFAGCATDPNEDPCADESKLTLQQVDACIAQEDADEAADPVIAGPVAQAATAEPAPKPVPAWLASRVRPEDNPVWSEIDPSTPKPPPPVRGRH
jgi:hypothetical protein